MTVRVPRILRLVYGAAALALVAATTAQAQGNPPLPESVDEFVHQIETRDPVKFLMDRNKPLKLTNPQRDSLKQLGQTLKRLRAPVISRLPKGPAGMPVRMATLSGGDRTMVDSLVQLNAGFRESAWAQLDETQRAQADELHAKWSPPKWNPPRRAELKVTGVSGRP